MSHILAGLRALLYMTGFVLVWGWLALQVRSLSMAFTLPGGSRVVGSVLMFLGGPLALWCSAWFVVAGRGTPAPLDAPRSFVTQGPYRWVRNPMYLGALVVLIGFGLWHASLSMILLAVPAAVLAHVFVIWYEEPTLGRRFGLPYLAYLALVNRWIPKRPRRGASQASHDMDAKEYERLHRYYATLPDHELQIAYGHGPTGYRDPATWELVRALHVQRRLLQDIEHSPIRYSAGSGISLDEPVVITGARHDLEGSAAIFGWLIKKYGTMNVDWRLRRKSGWHAAGRHIDTYVIQLRSGEEETFYFDITESFGKFSS